MATTTDAVFAEDVDIEREIQVRARGSRRSPKSGAASPGPDSDNDHEDAPLLNGAADDYGSNHGDGDAAEEDAWAGDADFRGLPWWKRPSVGP